MLFRSRFYKSARLVASNAEKIFRKAEEDLNSLSESVKKEIADLRRYRVRNAQGEVYTYADRILKREELLEEIEAAVNTVAEMSDGVDLFCEFFPSSVLRERARTWAGARAARMLRVGFTAKRLRAIKRNTASADCAARTDTRSVSSLRRREEN